MVSEGMERNKKILSLVDVIKGSFDASNWLELGLLTDQGSTIQGHGRLLRSLSFGDDDYAGHVLAVIMSIVRANPDNLGIVEDYVQGKFGGGETYRAKRSPGGALFSPRPSSRSRTRSSNRT